MANEEQASVWNSGDQVDNWVTEQARFDDMLSPFIDPLVDGAGLAPGDHVLDVGCGCGATTIAAARIVRPAVVTGVDLSGPMLARARGDAAAARIDNVVFEQADAQTHGFAADDYDAVISRFGVMFFDDPVAAFTNLRRATKSGRRLAFVCWQSLRENEWVLVTRGALAQHVPIPDPGGTDGPGMFAFGDGERLRTLLDAAGWRDVETTDVHTTMLVGGHGSVDDAVRFLRTGSLGRTLLADVDPDTEARAIDALRATMTAHHDGEGVRLGAAVWVVTANA